MSKKFELYNSEGQVNDPEIAREMAETENPYHKKRLGIFPPSKEKIKQGEEASEKVGDELIKEKEEQEQEIERVETLRKDISDFEIINSKGEELEVRFKIKDKEIKLFLVEYDDWEDERRFNCLKGYINGIELPSEYLHELFEKYELAMNQEIEKFSKLKSQERYKKHSEHQQELKEKTEELLKDIL